MPVRYILSSVWVRLSIFSPLSIIQYVGLYVFSLPISLVMIERIYILCLIIIIKSEVWTITHCLGLGHGTILSAVFLYSNPILMRCVRLPISIFIPYSDTRQLISVSTETNTKWQPNLDTFITIPIYMRPENVIILNGRQNLRNLAALWVLTSLFDDRIDAQAISCQASKFDCARHM